MIRFNSFSLTSIFTGLTVIAFIIFIVYAVNEFPKEKHTIVLSDSGFTPNQLTINVGENVEFSTNRNKPYWPASNEHPIHTVYSEFDPKRPLMPNETWNFTFIKPGQWEFHDHLNPPFLGTIIVR